MNIQKTNRVGLYMLDNAFGTKTIKSLTNHTPNVAEFNLRNIDDGQIIFNTGIFWAKKKDEKTLRLSESVINNAKLIDINSIKENLDVANIDFTYLSVLLNNDEAGIIRYFRFGSDINFCYMRNLKLFDSKKAVIENNNYSYLSKGFQLKESDDSIFAIQILTYLIYGDITNRFIPANSSIKQGYSRFLNNSKTNITFVDTLWKQRISTEGFKVSGHFRLQPIGEGRLKRKLIWIEEFEKHGYNRKATVELLTESTK